MTPTTYGYRNPDTGDLSKGLLGWMASYNFNILRLDGHTHNGIDSALLSSASFATVTQVASAGGWVTSGSGYKQTVTAPAQVTDINNFSLKFVINSGPNAGKVVYLQYNRLTGTTFDLFINDNTVDILIIYR